MVYVMVEIRVQLFEIRVTVVPVFNKIFIGAEARSGSGDLNLGGRGGHG